jgi:prepilin-type processing-associated H-X9-DG protein
VLVTQAADVKSTPLMILSMGAQVHVLEQGDEYSAIALIGRANSYQTGYIATSALTRPSDWVEAGLSCLHIPYKWGGRSYDGMDCSGLVQLAFAACGYDIPRDTGPQQAFMAYAAKTQDTGFGQFQRGDILFWDGHVAICIDGDDMLHANGFHHCVKIEPINTAIQRIARHSGQPTAHIDGQLLLSGLR